MPGRYGNRQKVDTRAVQLYNNNFGSLILGFFDSAAYVKIAPVVEEYRGQRARAGIQMYDYQKSIMMTLNQTELMMIVDALGDVVANRVPMLDFSHKSGNYIARFQCGIGLDGESQNLQVCMTKHERDYPDQDPIAEVWFEFTPTVAAAADEKEAPRAYQCEANVFKYWAMEALRVSFNSVVHCMQIEPPRFGGSGGGDDYPPPRRDDRDRDRDDDRPRRPREDRDDRDDDRPRRPREDRDDRDPAPAPRRGGAGGPQRPSRPARQEDRQVGEDGVPF